jgi:hypothetical protein
LKIKKLLKLIFKEKEKYRRKCFFFFLLAWTSMLPGEVKPEKKFHLFLFFFEHEAGLKSDACGYKMQTRKLLFSENFHIPPIWGEA